jgi:hypothetical protein
VVEAGGVGIFARVENRQLIENAAITKRSKRQIRAKLEHNWNIKVAADTPRKRMAILNLNWTSLTGC